MINASVYISLVIVRPIKIFNSFREKAKQGGIDREYNFISVHRENRLKIAMGPRVISKCK